MKITQAVKLLETFGWLTFKDDVGDRYAHFKLPDRTVQIIFGLDRIRDEQKFGATLSLTTEAFSRACSDVDPEYGDYAPYIRSWNGLDVRAAEILEEHVRQASDEAIAWAQDQDLDKALQDYAALPTDAPGARPVWHLASLALLGEVEKLSCFWRLWFRCYWWRSWRNNRPHPFV
jgi:hypothetical protein